MTLARRCLVLALATAGLASSAFVTQAQAAPGDPFVQACRTGVNAAALAGCTPNVRGRVIGSVLSPDGKHFYASFLSDGNPNTFNGIQVYSRDASTGALTQGPCYSGAAFTGCTTVAGLAYGFDMKFDPDGETLYHASEGAATLFSFSRNASTGALTPLPCFGAAAGCTAITPNNSVTGVAATATHVYARVNGAITVFTRDGSTGVLTPVNCVSETGGACADVVGIAGSGWRLVTAGNHLYATSTSPGGIAVFTRSGDTLTQPTGGAFGGCISRTGASGATPGLCVDGDEALATALAAEVSPSGNAVYVGASPGVTAYSRNASSGLLTQTDCVTETASPGCDDGTGVSDSYDLDVTPDGSDLIVGSHSSNALSFFQRASNGALTQRSGTAGCMSQTGSGGACQTVPALNGFVHAATSSNSRDVYVTSYIQGLVGHYQRDFAPVCQGQGLGVGHNTPLAVGFQCSDLNGDALTFSVTRTPASGLLGAIDQGAANVVYSPNNGFTGGDSFDYRASARGVDSNVARVDLSVAAAPPPPIPPPPPPPRPPVVRTTTVFGSLTFPSYTVFTFIRAKRVPAGATITVTCKAKKKSQQRRCPKRKSYRNRTTKTKKRLEVGKHLRKRRLAPGTKVTILIKAPKFRAKRITYTVRDDAKPGRRVQCLNEAGTRTASCV